MVNRETFRVIDPDDIDFYLELYLTALGRECVGSRAELYHIVQEGLINQHSDVRILARMSSLSGTTPAGR